MQMALRVFILVGHLSFQWNCAGRIVVCRLSDPFQDHLTDLRMDAQRFGDPAGDPGVPTGRLLDKGGNAGGDVMPWPKEVGVHDDLLCPIGDAGIKPLLNSRLHQLHVSIVNDAQAEALPHHLCDLTEKLV
jgi:hypothetical protein